MYSNSVSDLQSLVEQLRLVIPALPGFRTLSLFGSVADGRADAYSDLDMKVGTDDIDGAKRSLHGVLEQIGPIEFCWSTELRPGEWHPTIAFRDYGYYHRLDLALLTREAADLAMHDANVRPLADKPLSAAKVRPSTAYAPVVGSTGHFLFGQLIGGMRYLKARKRGQVLTCYRFASATAQWCARAMFDRVTGQFSLDRKLTTTEFLALDKLEAGGRAEFLEKLDFSTPLAMDRAVYALLTDLVEHTKVIAANTDDELPEALIERVLAFVRRELLL